MLKSLDKLPELFRVIIAELIRTEDHELIDPDQEIPPEFQVIGTLGPGLQRFWSWVTRIKSRSQKLVRAALEDHGSDSDKWPEHLVIEISLLTQRIEIFSELFWHCVVQELGLEEFRGRLTVCTDFQIAHQPGSGDSNQNPAVRIVELPRNKVPSGTESEDPKNSKFYLERDSPPGGDA